MTADDQLIARRDLPTPAPFSTIELGDSYEDEATARLPPPELKPWHRPRKQFVRSKQILGELDRLLNAALAPREEIRYLGLPGMDLMDLRMVRDACERRGKSLFYIGFDAASDEQSDDALRRRLNEDELRRLGSVRATSRVLPDRIQTLGRQDSAGRAAIRGTDFDLVNIDLCGSPLETPGAAVESIYEALNGILAVQVSRTEPWLLCITGLFAPGALSNGGHTAASLLCGMLDEIASRCEEVATALGDANLLDAGRLRSLDQCDTKSFAALIIAGLAAWIRSVAEDHRHVAMRLASSFCYRVDGTGADPDMYSLAFIVNPREKLVVDSIGLLSGRAVRRQAGECQSVAQFVNRVTASVDLDQGLLEDEKLFREMRTATAEMLDALGYDVDAYLASELAEPVQPS